MYRFAAGPTQSRRWIFHAECLTRVATNGPYTTTQHPSLSKISVGGCRRVGSALRQEYTRANRCPPSALRAPIRLNSARIPASSPLLACKTRLSFVVPSQPLHRSTQAFCRSSKCLFLPPCLADKVDTLPVGRQRVVPITTTTSWQGARTAGLHGSTICN